MNPVTILTISEKIPLFKGEEPATAIELIQLKEVGFEIVAQKDLYSIGEQVVYIQPDYCLPNIAIFDSYIAPNGDPKKSRLGSQNRIKAVKFNLHTGNMKPVYSQGILFPISEIESQFKINVKEVVDLTKVLGIFKWEEPENKSAKVSHGLSSFPKHMYKTDEDNINNLWNYIQYPIKLIGTEKIDGSSTTIYYTSEQNGICSRNYNIQMKYKKVVGKRSKSIIDRLMFWRKFEPNIYAEIESDSQFVLVGKPYLEKLKTYCIKGNRSLALRGELNGKGLKGSGNKNNPSAKNDPNILFFGVDEFDIELNKWVKLSYSEATHIISDLGFNYCKEVFNATFTSKQEIVETCEEYFGNNLIEGLVLRTNDDSFSTKYMNLEYDSKK